MKKGLLIFGIIAAAGIGIIASFSGKETKPYSKTITTPYGTFDVQEPEIISLIESKPVTRLKMVHQYGVLRYATPIEDYSRYDHSIGVFALLRKYDAPVQEQMAGLLHDVSHTAFSHVGALVFGHKSWTKSYSDDIHDWYLRHSGLVDILEKHQYTPESLNPKNGKFARLESDLPNLCADRLEYNLEGGLKRGLLQQREIEEILKNLKFEEGNWVFTNTASAKKLANVSLYLTEHVWGAPWGQLIYSWAADAIKRAIHISLISVDDIHFAGDDFIWHRLIASPDEFIQERISRILNYEKEYTLCAPEERDLFLMGKFRGIDPWVKTEQGLKRLTEIDSVYQVEFQRVRSLMHTGWSIKLMRPYEKGEASLRFLTGWRRTEEIGVIRFPGWPG